MKVSLIITVLNEGDNVRALLQSVLNQTLQPDEVVIVDGGSGDNTVHEIKTFAKQNSSLKIRLFEMVGYNIPKARNYAIAESGGEIILVTDGGCVLDNVWCESLTNLLQRRECDVASGPYASNYLQKCISKIVVPSQDEFLGSRFMASSRSLGFLRRCWADVGGYPEGLDRAEDTLFMMDLKAKKYISKVALAAVAFWKPRATIGQFARQMFGYAAWDGVGHIFSRVYLRCAINILFLVSAYIDPRLLVVYFLSFSYGLWRHRARYSWGDLHLLPGIFFLRLVEESVRLAGFCYGLLKSFCLGVSGFYDKRSTGVLRADPDRV